MINLVVKAMEGDEEAFEQLYKLKSKSIYFQAYKMLNNTHDAEDVMQEVSVYMYNNISKLKKPEAFHSWIHRITFNNCISRIRKKNKTKPYLNIEEYQDYLSDDRYENKQEEFLESYEVLIKIVNELPERRKQAIIMHYYEGYSFSEIAKEMNISVSAATSSVTKARKKIREEMGK